MRKIGFAALALSGLLVLSSFAPTIVLPQSKLTQARQVFVIDHGTHTSIAIETRDGKMVRFAYGDKRYYAGRDTSLMAGAQALLWPTPGTLGKSILKEPATTESLEDQLRVVVQQIYPLAVEAAAADQLIMKLNQIHNLGEETKISVPAYGLDFADHPEDYFWANNSSTMIADWLREMDVRVFGWGLLASWRVVNR